MTDRPMEPGFTPEAGGSIPAGGPIQPAGSMPAGGPMPIDPAPGLAASAMPASGARAADAILPAADLPAGEAGAKGGSGSDGPGPGGVSLAARLRQPRTIISIVVPIVMLVLIFRVALNVDFGLLVRSVEAANKLYLLIAFVVFYLGFPLRGFRWVQLLKGAGFRLATDDGTEILFLSWTVNCLVPAKLGDVYRAYLLNANSRASMSRTLGTVFIERILDIVVIAALGIGAGFWSFRKGLPPEIEVVVAIGVVVAIVLIGLLLTLRNFGRRLLEKLPLPERVLDIYDRFEAGVFQSVNRRALPGLVALTVLIWCTEGLRLFFVVQALGFQDVALGLSGAFFVALIASLLTAVPLSPAGLGIVELGVVGVLVTAYSVPIQEATTIALVDRAISVFSIILIGSIAYLVSGLPRGKGLRHPLPQDPGFVP